jgi:hypothetical protein
MERGDGSDYVHGLDLRSPQAACSRSEGGTPALWKITRWSETANGSLVLSEIGTTAERPNTAAKNHKGLFSEASEAQGRVFESLRAHHFSDKKVLV